MSGGDKITELPVDKNIDLRPADLEFINNLFQTKNTPIIVSFFQQFKLSLLAAILFFFLSHPLFSYFVGLYAPTPFIGKIVLSLLFMIVFFIIQKNLSL